MPVLRVDVDVHGLQTSPTMQLQGKDGTVHGPADGARGEDHNLQMVLLVSMCPLSVTDPNHQVLPVTVVVPLRLNLNVKGQTIEQLVSV